MPRKPAKSRTRADSWDGDLLTDAATRILRRHCVPAEWLEPMPVFCLVLAAWHGLPEAREETEPPARVLRWLEDEATPEQREAWTRRKERFRELARQGRAQKRERAGLIARLSAKDPTRFFRVMADLSEYVHNREKSPEFIACWQLQVWGSRPDVLNLPREDLASAISRISEIPVSAKVVEHAIRRLREAGLFENAVSP